MTAPPDDNGAVARPYLVLLICCLSLFMVSMDVTIVNVALPSIQHDFKASTSGLQWTVDAYTLVVASGLMLSGSMADRIGRKRVFQGGMALFCAGSVLCALAPSIGWLVLARMIQALGGTMLNPVAVAIISNTFPTPRDRARAFGVWGAVFGIAMAVGLPVGGFLTQVVGWRSIFWINVPFGLAAILLTRIYVPESRAARSGRLDLVGQMLVVMMLATLIAGVIEGPRLGWGSPATIAMFAVSGAALLGLLFYEPRRNDPLIDLQLFRSVPFASATAMALCCFAAFAAFLFLNSLFLQNVQGYTALQAGFCTLPLALAMILCPPISGRMMGLWGPRYSLFCAGVAMGSSALMLTQLQTGTPLWFILLAYALFGVGFGLVNTPITVTAVSGLPRDKAGLAAGIASTSRQVGASLGVALSGTIAGEGLAAPHGAMLSGTHTVWWLVVCGSLAIIVLGLVSTSRWGLATTRHADHLFAEEAKS
ncbi:MFS transporter [Beijerinckia sp. L45]|uniref:MFS transporter n=1 Tax=Beijerinckia sp. L45 TaxID=1641855 RepID=UPI00131C0308|nr:MFS transporter [Beijerinckia sp. L45]